MKAKKLTFPLLLLITGIVLQPTRSFAQEELPVYLRDRGTGIPVSMFGTYVRKGELRFYPFYEYVYDGNMEYEPFDFGLSSTQEFRGRFRAHEGLIFIGYGVSDKLALEFEAGVITADLDKSDRDMSPLPATIARLKLWMRNTRCSCCIPLALLARQRPSCTHPAAIWSEYTRH